MQKGDEAKSAMARRIPLARPQFDRRENELVKEALESRHVSNGPMVGRFEAAFAKYCSAKHAISVNSGTSAIQLALLAHGIGQGHEVIVPDFTFPATANAVVLCGATPVLCDSDAATWNIDPKQIESKITRKTHAIMPVHILGNPADMAAIEKIAKEHSLLVIEDAAAAQGAEYGGKKIGGTNTAAFSFHPRKIITTGEGGMITTGDDKIATACRLLRSHGAAAGAWKLSDGFTLPKYERPGFNMRMSDINAAVGIAQMEKIGQFISRREGLARLYSKLIAEKSIPCTFQKATAGAKHVYQTYAVRLNDARARDRAIMAMRAGGIECTIGYYSLSATGLYGNGCTVGNALFESTIALPLYTQMHEHDVVDVVDALAAALKK